MKRICFVSVTCLVIAGIFALPASAITSAGPALSVDVSANRKAISPLIYGTNYANETFAKEVDVTVNRWGGNIVSRYNWQLDAYNTGSDWYFENITNDNANPSALPDGSAADRFVEQNKRTGTASLISVPMIGWVAKRRTASHPYDCGFSIAKYGAQQYADPYDLDCGNGIKPDGTTKVTGNNRSDTSMAVTQTFVQGWINHLKTRYGDASNGGVAFYNLDNEPMLWNMAHRDVHPEPTSYDEMRDKAWAYAAAIKQSDPAAKVLGPAEWGWEAYFYSAADIAAGGDWQTTRPDRKAHGDVPFSAWYLQQMKAYEQANGKRILDYFDLHYYPQADGVTLGSAGDASTQALRLRSTRSLWDATYADESWIKDSPDGPAVRLIPRMREWIDANYPGTKLAIGEYNWGGLEHINGALAQADVLGIFGREGVDLAMMWDPPSTNQPGAYAFRMYRNYDGAGGKFGDVSVSANSADQGQLAIYAAQRSSDNALTLMVINKTGAALTSDVSLNGFTPNGNAQVYRYSAANLNAIVKLADQPASAGGFSASFPANSITLFVLSSSTTTPNPNVTPRVFLPDVQRP